MRGGINMGEIGLDMLIEVDWVCMKLNWNVMKIEVLKLGSCGNGE